MSCWTTIHRVQGRAMQLARLAGLQRIPPLIAVKVGAVATSGDVKRVKGPPADASRSAGENVIVLRTQAKQGRDIAFLTDQESKLAADMWREAFRRAWKTGNVQAVLNQATVLGRWMVRMFVEHIERGVGRDGIKPVTAATQKRKDREVGPGKPPLIRTGQLMRALTSKVERS